MEIIEMKSLELAATCCVCFLINTKKNKAETECIKPSWDDCVLISPDKTHVSSENFHTVPGIHSLYWRTVLTFDVA